MTYDAAWDLQQALVRNEKLVWSGRPPATIFLRREDALLIPFSIIWVAFWVFWEVSVIREGKSVFLMLWCIPFIVIGLFLTVGRFLLDRRARRSTVYGLTTQRLIVIGGMLWRSVHSYSLHNLPRFSLTMHRDGTGTIEIEQPIRRTRRRRTPIGWMHNRLERLSDAREVYARIVELQSAATSGKCEQSREA